MSTLPHINIDLAGPDAARRRGRPVDWPGTPRSKEEMERARVNRTLHAVGAQYGLTHEDLSDLADCSLATVHVDEMHYLIQMIPLWDQASHQTGEDSVCGGLIAHMENARTSTQVGQSWKLYSRLYQSWNKLTQLRARKAKALALWRVQQ